MSSPLDLSRRQFLCSVSATLAATSLATAPATARAGEFSGKLKKAVKYHMVQDNSLSPTQKFALLKELGFDGVEVKRTTALDIVGIVKAREETGLPIHGVTNSSNTDLRGAIDLAKRFGATSVLVVAGRVNEKTPYDENYRTWSALIREHAPYAEDQGLKLLVENVWNDFLLSPLEMVRFLDEIGRPNVGSYFDVGNIVHVGYPDQWIRILGQRIGKLDIKEYSRKIMDSEGKRKGFDVPIGEGNVNYPAVRAALKEIGYTGWATAEVKGGNRARLAEIAKQMNKALDL